MFVFNYLMGILRQDRLLELYSKRIKETWHKIEQEKFWFIAGKAGNWHGGARTCWSN